MPFHIDPETYYFCGHCGEPIQKDMVYFKPENLEGLTVQKPRCPDCHKVIRKGVQHARSVRNKRISQRLRGKR